MAVTIEKLRELRAAGAKAVEFTAKGEISSIEFFSEAPEMPGAEVRAVPEEPELPAPWTDAIATIQRRAPVQRKANGS